MIIRLTPKESSLDPKYPWILLNGEIGHLLFFLWTPWHLCNWRFKIDFRQWRGSLGPVDWRVWK